MNRQQVYEGLVQWDEHGWYDDSKVDEVNQPDHYTDGTIECIVYLKDNMTQEGFCGFLEGNTKKYLHRFRYKGKTKQDLLKAQWYLTKLIEETKDD